MTRVYWAIAKTSFQDYFAYRGNLYFELVATFVTTSLSMTLWYALFRLSGEQEINGYSLSLMIAYLLGVAFVEGTLHIQNQGNTQMDDINQGTLNNYLLRPFNPYLYWFVDDLSRKALMFVLSGATVGVAALAFSPWIDVSIAPLDVLVFVLSMCVAAVLHFLLFSLVVLATFWIGMAWGITFILRVAMGVATGALVPLSFFPDGIRAVMLTLPFQFFGYVPIQILLGQFTMQQALWSFGQMALWIVGLMLLCRVVYRRGLKVYGAYGG
jgi:ABC-2 type transport system permease protein